MTRKSTPTNAKPATSRSRTDRQAVTLEMVARLAPHQGLTDNLVRTFGLEPVDYDGIRDATQEHITRAAQAFGTALNEKALQIHLQRIIGSFVSSAFGAAQFYGTKKSAAMELTSKLLNDDRDEDRDGPIGFESKAERARLFAAEMALQSFALLAAAEGAIAAYADITGETWKPYEAPRRRPPPSPASPPPPRWLPSRRRNGPRAGRSRSRLRPPGGGRPAQGFRSPAPSSIRQQSALGCADGSRIGVTATCCAARERTPVVLRMIAASSLCRTAGCVTGTRGAQHDGKKAPPLTLPS